MLLKRRATRHSAASEGSWAISYVDMLTLLLCFFIIFYNSSQSALDATTLSPMQKIIFDFNNKGGASGNAAGSGVGSGSGTGTGTASTSLSPSELAFLEGIKSHIVGKVAADTKVTQKSLDVVFTGISFFDSGATKLRGDALASVEEMIRLLAPYKDSVRVVVQGHTDSRQVQVSRHTNMSDNWELSVLRATSVLKLFILRGFAQESLSAEGFADTRRGLASTEDLAKQRRVTLRIEPRTK